MIEAKYCNLSKSVKPSTSKVSVTLELLWLFNCWIPGIKASNKLEFWINSDTEIPLSAANWFIFR